MALPASLFESVPNLSQLRLDHNKLSVLSSRLFHPLTRLVLMDLSTNSLQAGCDSCLSRKSFKGLGSLIVLNLSRNQISSVQQEMFSDLTNLQRDDLFTRFTYRLKVTRKTLIIGGKLSKFFNKVLLANNKSNDRDLFTVVIGFQTCGFFLSFSSLIILFIFNRTKLFISFNIQ